MNTNCQAPQRTFNLHPSAHCHRQDSKRREVCFLMMIPEWLKFVQKKGEGVVNKEATMKCKPQEDLPNLWEVMTFAVCWRERAEEWVKWERGKGGGGRERERDRERERWEQLIIAWALQYHHANCILAGCQFGKCATCNSITLMQNENKIAPGLIAYCP